MRTCLVLEFFLTATIFFIFSGTLTPDVNEPNYLAKAKHFWNPDWCSEDFYLQTGDAHTVFYWVFGWLTLFLPLPTVALVGRLVTCGLLGYSWQKLSRSLTSTFGLAIFSAALLLVFNTYFHMAGEWVAGGFEAKGFAYGFVFLSLAALLGNHWNRAWILLGIATAFHILIGTWAVVAATIAWCILGKASDRPSIRSQIPGFVAGICLSIVGAWPAMALARDTTIAEISQAAEIHVFYRLPHHLNPDHFFFQQQSPYLTHFAIRFLIMLLIWVVFAVTQRKNKVLKTLNAFTFGVLSIATIGILISLCTEAHPILAGRLLRFYWFRLADVMLPAGIALSVMVRAAALLPERRLFSRSLVAVATLLLLVAPFHDAFLLHRVPAADRKISPLPEQWEQWKATCKFAREQTSPDAVFLTPKYSHTFKWYADRSEVANWKELPQDAPSVIVWWERIETIHPATPDRKNSLTNRSREELRSIGRRYKADYLVTEADPVLDLPAIYRNDSFAIYSLQDEGAGNDE